MTTTNVVIVALAVVLGVLVALVATWVLPPRWVRTGHTVIALVVLVAVSVYLTIRLDAATPTQGADGSAAPPKAQRLTVEDVAPELANETLVIVDDSAGRPELFSVRLNGLNRLYLLVGGNDYTFVPGSTDRVVVGEHGLELRDLEDNVIHMLTEPPDREADDSLAFARESGDLFFVRSRFRPQDDGSNLQVGARVMQMGLDPPRPPENVNIGVDLFTVSVSSDGTMLAGPCAEPDGGPTSLCIADLSTDPPEITYINDGATHGDVVISPDGHFIAYASPKTNPYGDVQVYVYEIGSGATTMISALPGWNDTPAWVPSFSKPCLVFSHSETGDSSIYLACLTPEPVVVRALDNASSPVWLDQPGE